MKTGPLPTWVKDFAPGDFFTYASMQYKVLGTAPHPYRDGEIIVSVVDEDGVQDDISLHGGALFDVTRDDGHLNAIPSHVVVDTIDGHVFSRDRRDAAFTLESATSFAKMRNVDSKRPTYVVFALVVRDQD